MINAGIPGETTDEGLTRLPEVLDEHSPDLVILLEGGNDLLRRKSHADIRSNLEQMVAIARQRGSQVLLLAVPELKLTASPPDLYEEIANSSGIPLMNDIVTDLEFDRQYKSDPIHLNTVGYRRLAEAVYQRLHDCGSIP